METLLVFGGSGGIIFYREAIWQNIFWESADFVGYPYKTGILYFSE